MAKKGLLGRLKGVLGRLWDETAPAVAHGSSEVASALYTGSGFVQYPRDGQATETMAQLQAEARAKEPEPSRDGRDQTTGPEL